MTLMTIGFRPLGVQQSIYMAVQDEVKSYIARNSLNPGDPLPPEVEWARLLGVSRGSVREAIKSLQTLGIVEARPGAGLCVGDFSLDAILNNLAYGILLDLNALEDLVEVRFHLEIGMCERATEAVTDDQLQRLDAILSRMRSAAEAGRYSAEDDRALHREFWQNAGNRMLLKVLDSFWLAFYQARERASIPDPPDPLRLYRQHVAIVEALARRDAAEVRTAMADHYEDIRKRIELSKSLMGQAWRIRPFQKGDTGVSSGFRRLQSRQSTFAAIQDEIKSYIARNSLKPGDPLPPETELSRLLGIGRNSVREAVKSLEALGIVQAKRGTGLFVGDFSFHDLLNKLDQGVLSDLDSLEELVEVRYLLETGMSERAVEEVTEDQQQRMIAILEQMREAVEAGRYSAEDDRAFHNALWENAGNQVLLKVLDVFWRAYHCARERAGIPDPADPMSLYQEHAAVFGALRRRDTEGLRMAMASHYGVIRKRIQQSREAMNRA